MDEKGFEKELQLALFTLIIGLGFFKINELHTFVETFTVMVTSPNLLSIVLIGASIIIYLIYIFSIGFGLFLFFMKKDGIYKAAVIALTSFFVFYFLVLVYNLSNTSLSFSK